MTLWLLDLESVESRYTSQWKTHLPKLLEKFNVKVVEGAKDIPPATTPGAFLNFGGTNIYKSTQIEKISRAFTAGEVKDGDHILFTDAWHPGIINIKYMSELLGIKVITHGLWHAGSYDPADFLGRLIGDAPWVRHAERSMFECFDHNYFATQFHIELFGRTFENAMNHVGLTPEAKDKKIVRTGWPMEYMKEILEPFKGTEKRDLILFPHRIAPEKQPDIFKDLQKSLPEYEFIMCQEKNLTKPLYHKLLASAKIVFSANLQETLGISAYEGAIVDTFPLVPDRLSYTEMYPEEFKYPSEWTDTWENYIKNKDKLIERIRHIMKQNTSAQLQLEKLTDSLTKNFFSSGEMINTIKSHGK
tara:strand:- start:7657 stop:8736 length:1080 start_codon:yes stop_codon:yes gene_type:complete